jgi:hypothetical protein
MEEVNMLEDAAKQVRRQNCIVCLSFLLLAVVGSVAASAGGAEAAGNGGPKRDRADNTPYIKISTPDGTIQVRFFGESDGPIQIPLKSERYTALLLSPELTEQGWRVDLGIQEDVFKISPIGRYDLTMGRDVPIEELDRLGIEDWSMRLETGGPMEMIDGCCGCGRLNCCPNAGKCMGCGGCGTCCGGPLEV